MVAIPRRKSVGRAAFKSSIVKPRSLTSNSFSADEDEPNIVILLFLPPPEVCTVNADVAWENTKVEINVRMVNQRGPRFSMHPVCFIMVMLEAGVWWAVFLRFRNLWGERMIDSFELSHSLTHVSQSAREWRISSTRSTKLYDVEESIGNQTQSLPYIPVGPARCNSFLTLTILFWLSLVIDVFLMH